MKHKKKVKQLLTRQKDFDDKLANSETEKKSPGTYTRPGSTKK